MHSDPSCQEKKDSRFCRHTEPLFTWRRRGGGNPRSCFRRKITGSNPHPSCFCVQLVRTACLGRRKIKLPNDNLISSRAFDGWFLPRPFWAIMEHRAAIWRLERAPRTGHIDYRSPIYLSDINRLIRRSPLSEGLYIQHLHLHHPLPSRESADMICRNFTSLCGVTVLAAGTRSNTTKTSGSSRYAYIYNVDSKPWFYHQYSYSSGYSVHGV